MRAKFNPPMTMRLLAAAAICCGIAVSAPSGASAAQDISVPIDEAALVRLDKPVTEVIIGNPSIADVAVQNGHMLVVTGKSFGVTNLIVLDAKGSEILSRTVRVSSSKLRTVRLNKGATRFSYDCAERCETTLMPGDNTDHFSAVNKAVQGKFGVAQSAIDGDPSGGQ